MFSRKVVEQNRLKLEQGLGRELREHTRDEVAEMMARLSSAVDKKGKLLRDQTEEEQSFIWDELALTKIDFEYWATRYGMISIEGAGVGPLYPLLDSQAFVMQKLGELEAEAAAALVSKQQGIFVNILKAARQVGVSTLSEAIAAHRFTTQNHILGLIAGAEPDKSGKLFGMFERFIEHLPWWMCPKITDWVKNTEMKFDGGAHLTVGSGKNMSGKEGERGELGRGETFSFAHLTELSSWENPWQLPGSLFPALPKAPRTFVLLESTALGKGTNWWYLHWENSKRGLTDPKFTPIYIPWYVEKKYSEAPPDAWKVSPVLEALSKKIEDTSPRWAGRKVTPTRSQLFWYEQKRAAYEASGQLKEFLENFGSLDDEECFQHSGRSVISLETQQAYRDRARPIAGVFEILPMREIRRDA